MVSVKKMGVLLSMGALMAFGSCMDDTYDMANKEVVTDVAIEGNRVALPLGDLKPIMLDSLIRAEENAAIRNVDGVYCVGMEGAIESMQYEIGSFKLSMEPSYSTKGLDFSVLFPGVMMLDGINEDEVLLSEVDIDAPLVIDEVVPDEVKRIEAVGFTEEVPINITISLEGLEMLDAHMHLDLSFEVPSFLDWYCVEEGAMREGDKLLVAAEMNPYKDKHLKVQLMCRGLHFDRDEFAATKGILPEKDENGDNRLEYATGIHIHGDVFIDDIEWHDHVLGEEVRLAVEVAVDEIEVEDFHGIYVQELEAHPELLELNLGDELAFLNGGDNVIVLSDPQVTVELENLVSIPMSADMMLCPIDGQGNRLTTIEVKNVRISPARYDADNGVLEPQVTRLLFTCTPVDKQGYVNVVVEELPGLLKELPEAVELVITPRIETDETHHVVLAKPLGIKGNYELMAPLAFDELYVCYNDTIVDVELGEAIEIFKELGLEAKMKVKNTTPLGMVVSLQALDASGAAIDGIIIEPAEIAAGNGGEFDMAEQQDVVLRLDGESQGMCKLSKLAVNIEATAKEKVALECNQGLLITDLVLDVSGDIEMNMEQ